MNKLETKCKALWQTPQWGWFEYRLKPLLTIINQMWEKNEIILHTVKTTAVMGFFPFVFRYDNEIYLLIIDKTGGQGITNCFHFEKVGKVNGQYLNILDSRLILSSDDDPHQNMYYPLIALMAGVKSNLEFSQKVDSLPRA